jgi:hypothetical protein
MLDKFEFLNPANAYDAFALFCAHRAHRVCALLRSLLADLQNVAFTCVESLGATVKIPGTCADAGLNSGAAEGAGSRADHQQYSSCMICHF